MKYMLPKRCIHSRICLIIAVLLSSISVFSQAPLKITGKVTASNDDAPLSGVTVSLKGTQTVATTNSEGVYSIAAAKGAILVFSYAGAANKEITVGGAPRINAALDMQASGMNEVVVVGYGTQKKSNVTGSVATVSAKTIENLPVSNISSAVVGRLPGLVAVNRGGAPGQDAPQISIRGFENMLIIVNGIQEDFNNIDPNEIESISILKDAAASIYGARAGNGVLLVTTKKGKSGKPIFSFSANQGWQAPTRIARRVDAASYAKMQNAAQLAQNFPIIYSDEDIAKYASGTDPAFPNTDWYKETFRKSSPIGQYNFNSTGGNDLIRYFFSVGFMDQAGITRFNGFDFKRFNIRSNVEVTLSRSFSTSLDISARNEQRDAPYGNIDNIMQDLEFSLPTYPAYLPDHSYIAYAGHQGTQPIGRADPNVSGYSSDNRKYATVISTFNYTSSFLPGLTAKALLSSNIYYGFTKNFSKPFNIYNYDSQNNSYDLVGPAQNATDQLNEALSRATDFTTQLSANYSKKFGLHDVNVLALAEFISSSSDTLTAHREGYLSTDIDQLFAGSQANKDNYGSAFNDGRIGYVGRLNYAYNSRYLVEATLRYDASARYIASRRWAYFPGVLVGWRLSQENFLRDVSFIDNLKLRASYGQAGNDYVGQFNYLTGFNFGGNYVLGDNPAINTGIISKGLANPNLTWEKTAISNAGLEGSFWKGLFGFEFDVFYRKVTNVAGTRNLSLPTTAGATLPLENINSYDNRGFELVLKHENRIGSNLRYSINGNITYARSKWLHFDEPVYPDQATRDRLQVSNRWKDQIFGYTAAGLFQSQDEIDKWPVDQDGSHNASIRPGDIKYLDYNHDGVLNDEDNHVIGQGFTPTVFFGLNLNLEYKAFSFSALFQGATNFNAYFNSEVQDVFFNGTVPYKYFEDSWSPDNPKARFPRIYPGGAINNQYTSTFWLQNANYLRFKTLQVGYTLQKGLVSRLGLTGVRLYVAGYNLITFDKIFPFDPETGTGRGWQYPQQKSVNIGANVSF